MTLLNLSLDCYTFVFSLFKSTNRSVCQSFPVTIFGNFYDGRKEEREKYLLEVREKVLGRTGTRPHNKITQEDVIHEELIPNIRSDR